MFFGDVMLGRNVPLLFSQAFFNKEVQLTIAKNSYNIFNLEAPVEVPNSNKERFSFDPKMLNNMKDFHGCSVANNHIFDQGLVGFEQTLHTLLHCKIESFGYKAKPKIQVMANNENIEIVGCMDFDIIKNKSEQQQRLFYDNIIDFRNIQNVLNSFGENAQKKMIYVHGGDEYIPVLNSRLKKIIGEYANYGIDFIIFCHSHVAGSYWKKGNCKVYFSLGDFIFDGQSYQRMKSFGLEYSLIKGQSAVKKIFFKRNDRTGNLEINDSSLARSSFNMKSVINKLINGPTSFLFFWFFMIRYQFLRILYIIRVKGFKTAFNETSQRVRLIRKFF